MNDTLYKKEIEEYLKNGGTIKCEHGEEFLARRFRTVEERMEMDRKEFQNPLMKEETWHTYRK